MSGDRNIPWLQGEEWEKQVELNKIIWNRDIIIQYKANTTILADNQKTKISSKNLGWYVENLGSYTKKSSAMLITGVTWE
jgi:hypothetical protein